MPTYDYKCKKCKYNFQKFQSMMDEPVTKCPKCEGSVEKIISSGAGVIFKGSGFYQTDYKVSNTGAPQTDVCPKAGKCPCAETCGKD